MDERSRPEEGTDASRLPVVAFELSTDPSYAEQATGFEVSETVAGVILRGLCPRCRDVMEFPYVARVYRGPHRRRRPAEIVPEVVSVSCTCLGDHPGRPRDEDGCGAYWNLVVHREGR